MHHTKFSTLPSKLVKVETLIGHSLVTQALTLTVELCSFIGLLHDLYAPIPHAGIVSATKLSLGHVEKHRCQYVRMPIKYRLSIPWIHARWVHRIVI
jgi:hypothetical protein